MTLSFFLSSFFFFYITTARKNHHRQTSCFFKPFTKWRILPVWSFPFTLFHLFYLVYDVWPKKLKNKYKTGKTTHLYYLFKTEVTRKHKWRAFMPPFRNPDVVFQLLKVKDCVNICKLVENERALLYPDSPGISEPNRLTVDKGYALTQPMLDQSIASGYHLPLNRKERKIWLDFKKLDEGNPESGMINFTFEEDEKRSINLYDPLVSVIGGFAVAAFNKACATHFKKDEQNNVHDFEYMECKYVKETKDYFFYLTIEAIEEGNLGVYEAIVVCSRDDGSRKLLKFVLTDRAPAGMKAMAISLFSCLISTCKTLELVGKARSRRLLGFHKVARGMQQGKASHELIFYEYLHRDTVKGIRRVISLNLHLLFQKKCTRTTNSDAWYVPDPDSNTGLKPRGSGTPCRGYDYNHYNQYLMGSTLSGNQDAPRRDA